MRQEFIPGLVFGSQQRAPHLIQPQDMTGDVRRLCSSTESLFWHEHIAKPPLWVVLPVQSQARKECESDSICIVVVWAGGQFFPHCIALHQDRSSPLCCLSKNARVKLTAHASACLWCCQALLCMPGTQTIWEHQTASQPYETCEPSIMAWVSLSHFGTLSDVAPPLGQIHRKGVDLSKCRTVWVSTLASSGLLKHTISTAPHTEPCTHFHCPSAWSVGLSITQTTSPSLQGEQYLPLLVVGLSVTWYKGTLPCHRPAPSTSSLTWLWHSPHPALRHGGLWITLPHLCLSDGSWPPPGHLHCLHYGGMAAAGMSLDYCNHSECVSYHQTQP